MSALPTPRTTTDQLLVALHDQIVGLRADLAASRGGEASAPPAAPRELTEPATSPSRAKRSPARKP